MKTLLVDVGWYNTVACPWRVEPSTLHLKEMIFTQCAVALRRAWISVATIRQFGSGR